MSGMSDLIGLGVLVVVVAGGWVLLQSGALTPMMIAPLQTFPQTLPSTRSTKTSVGNGSSGEYGGGGTGGGGYDTSNCHYAGYKGTPGWYTINGHHHCFKGQSGCVCTDPKKCYGHSGTGSQFCRQYPNCCTPGPQECAYWYSNDRKYCSLCQPGTVFNGHGSGATACG